jgi:hypothetical protein
MNELTNDGRAKVSLIRAMLALLAAMKTSGFDQRPDADRIRRAFDATRDALNALVGE